MFINNRVSIVSIGDRLWINRLVLWRLAILCSTRTRAPGSILRIQLRMHFMGTCDHSRWVWCVLLGSNNGRLLVWFCQSDIIHLVGPLILSWRPRDSTQQYALLCGVECVIIKELTYAQAQGGHNLCSFILNFIRNQKHMLNVFGEFK